MGRLPSVLLLVVILVTTLHVESASAWEPVRRASKALPILLVEQQRKKTYRRSHRKKNHVDVASTSLTLTIPRGGGIGPLDPTEVSKFATAWSLLHGTLGRLCDEATLASYQLPQTSLHRCLVRKTAVGMLALGVVAFSVVFQPTTSILTAIGNGQVVFLIEMCTAIINNEAALLVGYSEAWNYVWTAILAVVAVGCYYQASWSHRLVQIVGILQGVTLGIFTIVNPTAFLLGEEGRPDIIFLAQCFAYATLSFNIFVVALASPGVTPQQALGYAWIPTLVHCVSCLAFTKEPKELDKRQYYYTLPASLAIVATLAF
ncbi:expressed unknown protein [Seminavis robusta]|uniref:Uncharacterized protein n=1 Tax=Seminavis robusta TaxID=568900 RepID=A0A9N8F0A2_9STRA|nr:expressed unknown protein [Seminavis robusta]|eukprot:Sro2190_g318320.1 n/a (317) ;mRNA; r:14815-15765